MKKNINEMTIKEFRELPGRGWNEDIGEFNTLVILPGDGRSLHDSGYRCMDFVAVRGSEPISRLSGCSDVIHIDGIGGYGRKIQNIGKAIMPNSWSIDCLPKSGLLRLFCQKSIICGEALSSFEVYTKEDCSGDEHAASQVEDAKDMLAERGE